VNLRAWMTLRKAVTVYRGSSPSPDGKGAVTYTTSATVLAKAALWSASSADRYLSDRLAAASTHVLAADPRDYTWSSADTHVGYNGSTYRITGRPDDVSEQGRLVVVGLELIE